jgi:AP-2 complex subunit alpha
MLGYEVEFGHMHVVGLISAPKYSEKQVGYTVASVLLNETHEFLRLVINSVREDIISRSEIFQCLGLSFVANVGGREFADALAADVQRVLLNGGARPIVRKKAALALLRLFRRNKEILVPETFSRQLADLLDERDLGILSGVMSLLTGIVAHDSAGYEVCIPKVCAVMTRLARNKDIPADYQYYLLPSPWLQVKCLRALQYFPTPEDPEYLQAEVDVVSGILQGTAAVRNVNKNNALHAVLFEAVSLAAQLDLGEDRGLIERSVGVLGGFITESEPNIAYLGLNHLTNLVAPDTLEAIQSYIPEVIPRLHDVDISIRKRALDLLFAACDASNARDIVAHLLRYLTTADFAIREELALKTAILAERNADKTPDGKRWFLETCLTLIDKAGDFVSDAMWHRVAQAVTNAPELHAPAARRALDRLRMGSPHFMFARVAAYCLGEFGHALGGEAPPAETASLLLEEFKAADVDTRRVILSALAKIAMRADEETRKKLGEVFRAHAVSEQVEIQQRAVEYFVMTNVAGQRAETAVSDAAHAQLPGAGVRAGGRGGHRGGRRRRRRGGAQGAPRRRTRPAAAKRRGETNDAYDGSGRSGRGSVGEHVPTMGLADLLGGAGGAQAPVAGGLEDLLGAPAPAPAPATGAAASGALVDELSSLGGVGGAPSAAPAAALDVSARGLVDQMGAAPRAEGAIPPSVDLAECLKKLRAADNGLLYEDPYVQIGVKSQWQANQGRVMLYLGNKHSAELTDVSIELRSSDTTPGGLGLQTRLAPVPSSLGAKKQVQVLLELAATSAFASPPTLALRYAVAENSSFRAQNVVLDTPYGCHKFLQPWQSEDPGAFFAKWRELAGKAQKIEVVRVNASAAAAGVTGFADALRDVRLTPHPGLDPNPKNIVAAGIVPYTQAPNTTAMVRVESDANDAAVFRVTVAADDAATAEGVFRALASQVE